MGYKMIRVRCNYTSPRLDCRCILELGHDGKHNIPNNILKKEHPIFWEQLKKKHYPVVSGDPFHRRLIWLERTGIDKDDNPPPPAEKD